MSLLFRGSLVKDGRDAVQLRKTERRALGGRASLGVLSGRVIQERLWIAMHVTGMRNIPKCNDE